MEIETIGIGIFFRAVLFIKWPLNLKIIGDFAFANCTSLKEADMSKSHALETIGDAFRWCSALALVRWPPNFKTIGVGAFYECTSLKEADMSILHALETIGGQAFGLCFALALVRWPSNLKTVGDGAFEECTRLQNVTIPAKHHWFVRELPFDDETRVVVCGYARARLEKCHSNQEPISKSNAEPFHESAGANVRHVAFDGCSIGECCKKRREREGILDGGSGGRCRPP